MIKLFRSSAALAVLALAGVFASSARASSLGLVSAPPDMTASYVSVSYTQSNGKFQATGYTTAFDYTPIPSGGTFTLDAYLSGSGAPISGTLNVTDGSGNVYFSSTDLEQFSFTTNSDPSPETFEFLFGPGTAGSSIYGTSGPIGVILVTGVNDPYAGSLFAADFNNIDNGLYLSATSDTYAVPLPRAAYMGFAGLALLPLLLRRRRIARIAGWES